MQIFKLLLATTLVALLGGFPASVLAADDAAIKVTSIAQMEVEVTDKSGKKVLKRTAVEKAVPGDTVIFTTTFKNTIDKPAGNIVINNPIPPDTAYVAGSAFGKDCEIQYSADGGKTYARAEALKIRGADGKQRLALPREYTDIRWNHMVPLAAGKSAEVGFRAVIK
jgi:uncharacterized repeat protein (TIGR01451 family)